MWVEIHNSYHDTTATVKLHDAYYEPYIKTDVYRRARKKLCPRTNCRCEAFDSVWSGVKPYDRLRRIAQVAASIVKKANQKE